MISFTDRTVTVDGNAIQTSWPILDARETDSAVYVLLDPDSYLGDSQYRRERRAGMPAVRNLIAIDRSGSTLWAAEMPKEADYYYKIISVVPLVANSFSSFRCELDAKSGKILGKEFFK